MKNIQNSRAGPKKFFFQGVIEIILFDKEIFTKETVVFLKY